MMTPEHKVKDLLMKYCNNNNILCRKIIYEGEWGAPDWLLIKNGKIIFAELKAEGKSASFRQEAEFKRLKNAGAKVVVIHDENELSQLESILND